MQFERVEDLTGAEGIGKFINQEIASAPMIPPLSRRSQLIVMKILSLVFGMMTRKLTLEERECWLRPVAK